MIIKKSRWIDTHNGALRRVGLAFSAYGYRPPDPDTMAGTGAYVGNIVRQYQADLSEDQALALIEYGLTNTAESLAQEAEQPQLLLWRLDELTSRYLEQARREE